MLLALSLEVDVHTKYSRGPITAAIPRAQNGVLAMIDPRSKCIQASPNPAFRTAFAAAKIAGPVTKLELVANVTTAASAQLHRLRANHHARMTVPGTMAKAIAINRSAIAVDPTPVIPVTALTTAVPASPEAWASNEARRMAGKRVKYDSAFATRPV